MKLSGRTTVLVPWTDASTEGKNWFTFLFHGSVDSRRIYREVAKAIKRKIGRQVSKQWIQRNCVLFNSSPIDQETIRKMTEDFIERIQTDENQSIPDTQNTGETS